MMNTNLNTIEFVEVVNKDSIIEFNLTVTEAEYLKEMYSEMSIANAHIFDNEILPIVIECQ